MKDLAGKTAVITGAASGIGRALADECARAGMHVVVADIDVDAGQRAAEELRELGVRAIFVETDVTDLAAVEALADAAYAEFGAVHLLCNNVGVMGAAWMSDLALKDWEWIIAGNLWSVVNGIVAFVPRMRGQPGEKHIMNTGSPAAYVPVAGMGPFNAAKFAVTGLTETLREELPRDGIGVTMFNPAHTLTNLGATSELQRKAHDYPAPDPELLEYLAERRRELHETSLQADEVARLALEGVRQNRAFVFTHPTPARYQAAKDRFDAILAAHPVEATAGT